jgi:hypothetical protein
MYLNPSDGNVNNSPTGADFQPRPFSLNINIALDNRINDARGKQIAQIRYTLEPSIVNI